MGENVKVKRNWSLIIFVLLTLTIFFLIFANQKVSAVGEITYCCEKTTTGAWCQNSPPAECAQGFRKAPTSCESTSYCKLGTCVDSQEGTCLENTPQKVCQDNSGVWVDGKPEDIPQCQLGCCFIGDNAAFVTQTRCKRLASVYGTETNFRTDINSEAACIASAFPSVKGACVLDDGFQRNCRLLTRDDCQKLEAGSTNTSIEFHEGLLCSAESLGTMCGPTQKTACVQDKDEVHFLDSCGNLGNIYDFSKINDKEYWSTIKEKTESCSPDSSNANSATCGNCNYLLGSTCKAYERGNPQTPTRPSVGDFICADLSCKYQGKTYEHGETWCGSNAKSVDNKNSPGSSDFRLVCYNGEVSVEQCAAFRGEVCLQDDIDGFKVAQCVVNKWQDCAVQENKKDCENSDQRDCLWLEGESLLRDDKGKLFVVNKDGELVQGKGYKGAACVPKNPPGFDFWNAQGEAEQLCMIANENCIVKFQKGLLSGWDCKENCECLGKDWEKERNNVCLALGDCGAAENYIGIKGFNNESAIKITKDFKPSQ
ncbi:MAG: hypothetical protein AABX79_03290 [Nanoarchaeota archaeon]